MTTIAKQALNLQKIIAIDAMGGDFGASVTVPASLAMLDQHSDLHIILLGNKERITATLSEHAYPQDRVQVVHASEVVGMAEDPLQALRQKKDSSMRRCLEMVRDQKALACVSAGNTGALLAMANYVLGRLPNIKRPGLITALPTKQANKAVYIMDLGANVDSLPSYLHDFAIMGSKMLSSRMQQEAPRVALLNNGHEAGKGNQLIKEADQLLQHAPINYVGYIEADAIYNGDIDLVICDGFVGNIMLKAAEGVAAFIQHQMKKGFRQGLWPRLMGIFAGFIIKKSLRSIHPDRYNGASLLGLNGIVIKSHGGANTESFCYAISEAIQEVNAMIVESDPAHGSEEGGLR